MLSCVFCHFCEIHGPSVVFCTDALPGSHVCRTESPSSPSSSRVTSNHPTPSTSSSVSSPATPLDSKPKRITCDGCSFDSRDSNGFVSFDDTNGMKFVSSCQSELDNSEGIIKQSCIRSLSCEIYPEGREGIIYFGDDIRGHVLSCCFVLKDSSARGFQRTYSILVISRKRYQILNNWNSFVTGLEKIVKKLKEKANRIYDREVTGNTSEQEKRSIRLDSALQVVGRGRSPLNTQRSESRARSLKDLTNDSSIFAVLHGEMSFLLRQMTVKPRPPSQSNHVVNKYLKPGSGSNLRRLYAMIGKEKFKSLFYHVLVGHQVVIRSNCPQTSNKILMSLSSLLPDAAVKLTLDAEKYYDRKTCNFISISTAVSIPTDVLDSSDVVIMDLLEKDADRIKCTVHVKGKLPDLLPRYLIDLERIIYDTNFSDDCLDYHLLKGKHEWLERAKIAYAFVSMAKEEDANLDEKSIINSALSRVKKITSVDLTQTDTELLLFWMKNGVDTEYKQKVSQLSSTSLTESPSSANTSTASKE